MTTAMATRGTPLLDRVEARRYLNVGQTTLWALTASGKIRCIHIGRRVLYRIEDLEKFIAQCRRN